MKTIIFLFLVVQSATSLFAQPFDIKTIPAQCVRNIQSSNELLYGISNRQVVISNDSGITWFPSKWQPDLADITTEDGLKSHEGISCLWVDDTTIYCGISGMNFNHLGQPYGGGGIARSNGNRIGGLNVPSVYAKDSYVIAYQQWHIGQISYSTDNGNTWTNTQGGFELPAGVIGEFYFSQGPYVSTNKFVSSKPLLFIDSLSGGYRQIAVSSFGILAAIHRQKNVSKGSYELYYSLDTGKTWIRHPNDVPESVKSIQFIGKTLLLANNEPCNIVSVEDHYSTQQKTTVYPNPASEYVVIDGIMQEQTVTVFSSLGSVVTLPLRKQSQQSWIADVSHLQPGVYTVVQKEQGIVRSNTFVVLR